MLLNNLELADVLVAVVVSHPARSAVVEGTFELRRSNKDVVRDFVNNNLLLSIFVFHLQRVDSVIEHFAGRFTTNKNELVLEVQSGVVLNSQEICLQLKAKTS